MIVSALSALLLGSAAWAGVVPPTQVGFNDVTIDKVEADLLQIAIHRYAFSNMFSHAGGLDILCSSWELGTACEALTELRAPKLSVFSPIFPPPHTLDPRVVGDTKAMINISTTYVPVIKL